MPRTLNNQNITKPVIGYNAGEAACVKGISKYKYDELCAREEPTINQYQLFQLSTLLYKLLHPYYPNIKRNNMLFALHDELYEKETLILSGHLPNLILQ